MSDTQHLSTHRTHTTRPARTYVNVFGRRPGRGIRPWLLIPKVLAVAVYLGGLAAATFIWISGGYTALPAGDPRRAWLLDLVGQLMVLLVVPALLAALTLGALLFLQYPGTFLRMRWIRTKLLTLLILIPAGHFWCRAQTQVLRDGQATAERQMIAANRLSTGMSATLAGSVFVVAIGRLKPRFGQATWT